MCELWKFNISHEMSSKSMKIPWILHLKWVTFKMNYFSWKLMKIYKNNLNLISEIGNVELWKFIFFMKSHQSVWKKLESEIWTKKGMNFESLIFLMKCHQIDENHLKLISEMENGWTLKV